MAGTRDYTFVLARLGLLHLGCNKEVAALLRWLLTQVLFYHLLLLVRTDSEPVTLTLLMIDQWFEVLLSFHSSF